MAQNQTDTAKHAIRILQQGGAAGERMAEMLSKGNKSVADALLRSIKSGATEAESVAIVRKKMGALSKEAHIELMASGLKSAQYQALATTAYLGILTNRVVNGYKMSEAFVQGVFKHPFPGGGPSVNDLFTGQMGGMGRNMVNVTRDAYLNGNTTSDMAKAVRELTGGDTGAATDAAIRRKADALARTAISKAANSAREKVIRENSDIADRVMFVSTLDHRTSSICMVTDGNVWFLDDPSLSRPPLHVNCRSTLVPILKGESIEEVKKELSRPRVEPKSAEALEKQGLKTRTGRVRKPSTTDRSPLERIDGGKYQTYDQWLKKQSAGYQKEILGPKAYKEYKKTGSLNKALGQTGTGPSTWKPPKGGTGGGGAAPVVKPKAPSLTAAQAKTAHNNALQALGSIKSKAGGKISPIPEIPKKTLSKNIQRQQEMMEDHMNAHNVTQKDLDLYYKNELESIKNSHLHSRVREGTLEKILSGGRFKSQFEVKTSQGTYDPTLRAEAERNLFGVSKTVAKKDRPIYGFLSDKTDGYVSHARGKQVDQYGDITITFKSKVKERTTFTGGDSLAEGIHQRGEFIPSKVTEPKKYSLDIRPKWEVDGVRPTNTYSTTLEHHDYIEAQIFGQALVEDIASVHFYHRPSNKIIALLKQADIEYTIFRQ